MVGGDDFLQVGVGELAVDAGAHFPRVDEEGLAAAVAQSSAGLEPVTAAFHGLKPMSTFFVLRDKPAADGNLSAVEELAGEGAAEVAFAGLVGGQAAIGEVVNEVLHPGRGNDEYRMAIAE